MIILIYKGKWCKFFVFKLFKPNQDIKNSNFSNRYRTKSIQHVNRLKKCLQTF